MSQISNKSINNEEDNSSSILNLKPGEAQFSAISMDSTLISGENSMIEDGSVTGRENEENENENFELPEIPPVLPMSRCIVSYAGLDIRVFNENGSLLARLDPHDSSNNIIGLTVSTHLGVLFCIFDTGLVVSFCCRTPNCPILKSYHLPHFESEKSTCLVLVDQIPRSVAGAGSSDGGRPRYV